MISLNISGMHCASCVARVEKFLGAVPGVKSVSVNLLTNEARVEGENIETPALISAVAKSGYEARLKSPSHTGAGHNHSTHSHTMPDGTVMNEEMSASEPHDHTKMARIPTWRMVLALVIAVPLLFQMFMFFMNPTMMVLPDWLAAILATVSLFWMGSSLFKSSWRGIKVFRADMDLLVVMGATAAWGLSIGNLIAAWISPNSDGSMPHLYFEATAVLIAFILLGRWLEDRAKSRTASAIGELHKLAPSQIRVKRRDSAAETMVTPADIAIGDLVIVMAGERIPVDGIIQNGSAAIDEAMLTGEPLPVARQTGDRVMTGTMNLDGRLEIIVKSLPGETLLAGIIRSVETAQSSKPQLQRLVDRVASDLYSDCHGHQPCHLDNLAGIGESFGYGGRGGGGCLGDRLSLCSWAGDSDGGDGRDGGSGAARNPDCQCRDSGADGQDCRGCL